MKTSRYLFRHLLAQLLLFFGRLLLSIPFCFRHLTRQISENYATRQPGGTPSFPFSRPHSSQRGNPAGKIQKIKIILWFQSL